jgi:type I restriction enzyme, S subunit
MSKSSTVCLGEILETLETGSRPKGGVSAIANGIPSIGGEHITRDGGFSWDSPKHVSREFFHAMTRGRIRSGDVLIVKDGATTGKTATVSSDFPFPEAAINEHVYLLRMKEQRALSEYVGYYLRSPEGQAQILSRFQGAAIGGIPQDFVKAVNFRLPSISDQHRIIAILDQAENLRTLRHQADRRAADLVPALFHNMFGDPMTNEKGWLTRSIGKVAPFITSGSRGWAAYYAPSGDRFVRVQDITGNTLGSAAAAFVKAPATAESQRALIKSGDVLLAITGNTIGLCAIAPDNLGRAYVSQHVAIMRFTAEVNPVFAWAFMTSPRGGQRLIAKDNYGQTKPGISLVQLRKMEMPLPPLPLQKQFAAAVADIRAMQQQQAASKKRLDDLFHSLLHRAFRGEL